jgi:hypothetical protein
VDIVQSSNKPSNTSQPGPESEFFLASRFAVYFYLLLVPFLIDVGKGKDLIQMSTTSANWAHAMGYCKAISCVISPFATCSYFWPRARILVFTIKALAHQLC